jgi:serine/threonine protein kinase
VGGQAAEQIIAGVVLSERLAVTMYGQFSGQRNLRGLVVDPKMLGELAFRGALTDAKVIATALRLEHRSIVPTFAVEEGGPDVVVVTRGVGRYVTVQDLMASARSHSKKLPLEIAALIGRSVVEALAAAHKAGVVHGAVHPRSVLIDESGDVRLGDFVVGRALTTAVAQGADSSLWRGLAGYLAPELVVGEDPTPAGDVFAVGAMLFTMLSGEVPPGTLHVTPAVERLVQRALDTDVQRRYRSADDLLENMLEAFEDDRWELGDRAELIKVAGFTRTDTNVDDATEDLLASLGNSAVQVTPTRPSMDLRAEAVAMRQPRASSSSNPSGRLDALLADLDEPTNMTQVDERPFKRDPISELIELDPRAREAIVQVKRVPSLDDVDEPTPLPPPSRESDGEIIHRPNSNDESAAMNALAGLDGPVRRVSTAADQMTAAASKLEQAAARAEAAADRVDTGQQAKSAPRARVAPIVDPIHIPDDAPAPRLRSRALGIVSLLVVVGGSVAFYFVYQHQTEATEKKKEDDAEKQRQADEDTARLRAAQVDPGALDITSTPSPAGVWLRLGRTPLDTALRLSATSTHEIGFTLDGYAAAQAQVTASNWTVDPKSKTSKPTMAGATIAATLTTMPAVDPKAKVDPKAPPKVPANELPLQPTAIHAPQDALGQGPIHITSTPTDAEAWLYIGHTNEVHFSELTAGRDYELLVVKPGFKPRHVSIKADEWREGGNPNVPIDVAKKKAVLDRAVTLDPLEPAKGTKGP